MSPVQKGIRPYLALGLGLIACFLVYGCGVEELPESEREPLISAFLAGFVKDSSGNGVPQAEVALLDGSNSTLTDSAGAFSFGQVQVTAILQFIVQGSGFSAVSNELDVTSTSESSVIELSLSADKQSVEAVLADDAPDPTPGAGTPRPTATASSIPSRGYDSEGNTIDFGIPSGVVGNAHRGKRKWQERCVTCHSSLVGTKLDFSELRRTISRPPMNISLSSGPTADLVAYLHFR